MLKEAPWIIALFNSEPIDIIANVAGHSHLTYDVKVNNSHICQSKNNVDHKKREDRRHSQCKR